MNSINLTKSQPNAFKVGDLVKVTTKNLKENKILPATFQGIVISIRGRGQNQTFTVRKKSDSNVFVEKIFPLASPTIENIKVLKSTKVRRAKLYYLRNQK